MVSCAAWWPPTQRLPPPPPGVWIPPPRPGPSCSTRRSVVSSTPPAPCTLLSHILLFTFFVCLFYPFRLRPLLSLLSYLFLASLSHFFLFFFSPPAPFSTSTCRHPPPLPTIIPSSLTLGFMLLLGAVCFVLHSMPSSDSSLLTYSSWPICFHCPLLGFSGWGLESALHKFCSTGEVGKVEEVVKRFIVRMNGSTNTYYFLLAQDALFSGA